MYFDIAHRVDLAHVTHGEHPFFSRRVGQNSGDTDSILRPAGSCSRPRHRQYASCVRGAPDRFWIVSGAATQSAAATASANPTSNVSSLAYRGKPRPPVATTIVITIYTRGTATGVRRVNGSSGAIVSVCARMSFGVGRTRLREAHLEGPGRATRTIRTPHHAAAKGLRERAVT